MKIWQGGRQDGLVVVCNCLLVKGWKFPSRCPEGLQGYGVPLLYFIFSLCMFIV